LVDGHTRSLQRAMAALFAVAALGLPSAALAEVKEVQIARGFAIPHLPIMIMEHDKLLEKHALAAGLGEVKVLRWQASNVRNRQLELPGAPCRAALT